jgi:hypothetical protein
MGQYLLWDITWLNNDNAVDLSAIILHLGPGHLFRVGCIMHVVSPVDLWQSLLTFNGLLIPQNLSSEFAFSVNCIAWQIGPG